MYVGSTQNMDKPHIMKYLNHAQNDPLTRQAPPSEPTTYPLPADQPTTAEQQCSSASVSVPVRKECLALSRVFLEDPVRSDGNFVYFTTLGHHGEQASPRHLAPTTHHPPQQYSSSAAVRANQSTTAAHRPWCSRVG